MTYNLVLDSAFKDLNNWKLTNCKLENNFLVSNDYVFGVEQELYLPNISKLYLRWFFNIFDSPITNIKVGFQIGDVLKVNIKTPKFNKNDFISVIEQCNSKCIKIHIIFESSRKDNKVFIKDPLLIDLSYLHLDKYPKWVLDKKLKFISGYSYKNLFHIKDLKSQLSNINYEDVKNGVYLILNSNTTLTLDLALEKNRYYLIKVLFENINDLGSINLKYGFSKSNNRNKSQRYLIFKENNIDKVQIQFTCDYNLPYKIFLKDILIIPLSNISLQKDDIERLVYN